MHCFGPALLAPALLAADLALLEISKLPEVVHRVEIANLHKPGSHTFHHLAPGLESAPPVRLPLEKVTGVERVGAQLKDAAELSGRGRWPERELLHERGLFAANQAAELLFKGWIFRVAGDGVQGGMIALIALIFPDVYC